MDLPTIPPPHPAPHPPRAFTPPPESCDAHCHIFGPAARFPYSADRAYTPPDSGIGSFERLQFRLGLSRAVFVQASCHGTDNMAMVDALERGEHSVAHAHFDGAANLLAASADPDNADLALARFGMARALAAQAGEPTPAARALAEQALAALRPVANLYPTELAELRAWLVPR